MHFDDRLATVLGQQAGSEAIARALYRQLLDLLGTLPAGAHSAAVDAAYLRLAELGAAIPAAERAAMLSEPALRVRSPRLVSELALHEPAVATAAIGRATLAAEQWLDLIPALPVRARGLVRHRRDLGPKVEALLARLGIADRGLPPGDYVAEPPPARPVAPAPAADPPAPRRQPSEPRGHIDEIGAIVRRIEAFRKTRAAAEHAAGDAPLLPLGDAGSGGGVRVLETFDFATDAEGRIVWAEGHAAPAAVGLRLAAPGADEAVQGPPTLAAAFRRRQPIVAAPLTIAGGPAIAGEWQLDAAPRFDQPGGRFVGYRGRMRRPAKGILLPPAKGDSEADRTRQILHELRTPVNAIQGFAEVIQQQLYGATPHEYRALAAAIAGDAARMLAAFEELERLVKLDSGALELDRGECDLAPILAATIAQLSAYAAPRRSGFLVEAPDDELPVALPAEEAQRLVWRLMATLAGASAPGEMLRVRARRREDGVRLTLRLPAKLAMCDDDALFHAGAGAQPSALATGMFGAGFALRLAAAEARAAGGMLERRAEKLRLTLPAGGGAPAAAPAPASAPRSARAAPR